jgi:Predicted dehydrogenases and related proteins
MVDPGTVLVRVDHSCISIGTELSGIRSSAQPLWKKALKQPEKLKQVLQLVASQGLSKTRSQVQGKVEAATPTGYSAAGVVIEVGAGIQDLRPGDRVACAGAQFAYHADVIRVPRNLVVRIPEHLDFASASTVTLGAIALQGVRRAQPTLGETFVVIGLGILGQLTVQMLKANGCRVVGLDIDPARVQLALGLGMDWGADPGAGSEIEHVWRLTGGIGADGVIVTAASASSALMSTAFKMCRKKGRVVLVGDVGLNLERADIYQKELEFYISTSYGPGRYDPNYEEKGHDYPIGYVRWTENRNMAEYLRLVAEGRVTLTPLISDIYPITEADRAYEALQSSIQKPLMVLLSYPSVTEIARTIPNPSARASNNRQLRLAVVGAGGFARGMHLPNLQALQDRYYLQAIVSRTGHNAVATAKQFGATYASTDFGQVLRDPEVDAVLIATRHDLHARMALDALKAGKHVLVEKPLALTSEELEEIQRFYSSLGEGAGPVLLTGFNRRFSKYARRIKEMVEERSNPMIINYRMNAGYMPLDHWVHTEEGGGRNRGEACHIYDLFTYLTGSRVMKVTAQPIAPTTDYYSSRDNFVATMAFADGSVATLTYTALGSNQHPKEQMELFVDGRVIVMHDYQRLTIAGARVKGLETKVIDKGQREELEAFAASILQGGAWPIPLWQQVQATDIALQVEQQLGEG